MDFARCKSQLYLKTLIQAWILDPLAFLCKPIAFEVLRHATHLGQQWRAAGFNAGFLDLVIAALCIHHDAEFITFDTDYLAIARSFKLRVHHLSRGLAECQLTTNHLKRVDYGRSSLGVTVSVRGGDNLSPQANHRASNQSSRVKGPAPYQPGTTP